MTDPAPDQPPAPRPVNPTAYRLAHWVMGRLFDGYIRTTVTGRERLPAPGVPTLLVANHTSSLDPFAAGYALDRPAYFVAKVEATRIPGFGRWLLACGAIPAQRDGADTEVLRQAMAVLKAGHVMGIAPEGTRSPDGRLQAFDPGFVWLAARTGAVVLPCAIHGATYLMPKGAQYPRRGRLWVRFGAPRDLAAEGRRISRERMQAIADETRAVMLGLLAELARETGVPNPAVDSGT